MSENDPESLFRFIGNIEFAKQFLGEKKLAMPHASKLNDPFDPPLYIHGDKAWQDAVSNWERSEEEMRNKALENLYIASFCSKTAQHDPIDNLYMWGHYADGHRGVAIEFNFKLLKQSLNRHANKTAIKMQLAPVEYTPAEILNSDDLRKYLSGEKDILEKNLKNNLNKKTPNWKEEYEYRFMFLDQAKAHREVYKISIFPTAVKAIYLGMKNDEDANLIRLARSNFSKTKLYKASKVIGKLELEFKEIGT